MKHILISTFSLLLILVTNQSFGQETTATKPLPQAETEAKVKKTKKSFNLLENDTVVAASKPLFTGKKERYGLRVGVDLYKLSRSFYDANYTGIEFVGDYRISKKHFLAAEIGAVSKTTIDTRLTFVTKGQYLKAGFDYNVYENWLDMENIISLGMRGGFSNFNQELVSYKIYNSSHYFDQIPDIVSGQKYSRLYAGWIEIVAGMKAKLFNNVFAGFNLSINTLVSNKKPDNFDNLYIPGFNRTYNGNFGVGFNYSISYFIPLYKKNVEAKPNKK